MKDFAKSVRTKNATIDPKDDTLRKLEDELRGWLKTYDSKDPNVDKTNVEKNIREIRAEIEKYKRKHNIWNTNAGNSKVGNENWGRARDAQGWYETYTDAVKEGDQNKIERYKNKLKDRLHDMELKRKEILDDLKDTEEAIKIYRKVGNKKVGNYMMNPSGQVEDLIKSSEKYIASGDKEGAKRLFGSMEIVFRQLKEDKEEHYKKYQEADDLLGKLNKAAGKLKSIL